MPSENILQNEDEIKKFSDQNREFLQADKQNKKSQMETQKCWH